MSILLVLLVVCGSYSVTTAEWLSSGSVVINEVMWMGTVASTADEWIELYNTTDSPVDIGDWSIHGADTGVCLNFADADGSTAMTIPENGFFIYANHEDDVLDSDSASLVDIWDVTVGLNDLSPGLLTLYSVKDCDPEYLIDTIGQITGDWFAGDKIGERRSMERIDPNDSGSLSSNWCTNDGVTINGLDANGDKILGTPKIQNSCYLESPTPVLTPSPQTLATPTAGQAPTSTPSPTSTLVPTAIPSATDEPEPEMLVTYYYPPQIVVGEGFDVSINVENFAPSVEYYVKWLLGDDAAGSKLYDGRTLGADGESWLAWNAAWSKMPVLTTDSIGAGAITIKVKTDDDVQLGTNYIKVRLRRIDNDKNIDTEIGEIVVLASDGLLVIVPTLTPTPVEERADSTESEFVFTFGLPTEVQVDEPFEIPLALCGAEADVEYYVKVLAGLSEGSKMYDGRTLGSDGESWLAWNVLWGKMPVLQIAENGCGTVVITASINVGEGLGAYKVVVRLRRVGSNSNIDSSARVIQVRDEKVDSETTSQVLGAVQVLPRTGKSLEELIISISGSFVNLLKVDFRRINSQASWKR